VSQLSLKNSPLEGSSVVVALIENYGTSKPFKVSSEKSEILSSDTVVANERFDIKSGGMVNYHQESKV